MRISDWSSDVCSSDLRATVLRGSLRYHRHATPMEQPMIDFVSMRQNLSRVLLTSAALAFPCQAALADHVLIVSSPDHVLQLQVSMNDGQPQYQLSRFGAPVLGTSRLGLQFSDAPSLADGLSGADSAVRRVDKTRSEEHTTELQSQMRIP